MKKTVAMFVALLFTGCSTFQSSTQPVKLICPVPDTTVMVNGQRTACPSVVRLPRDRNSVIEAYKDGYLPAVRNVGYHFGTCGKWDLAGTIIWFFPIVGTWTAGAWDLDTDEVNLDLFKRI